MYLSKHQKMITTQQWQHFLVVKLIITSQNNVQSEICHHFCNYFDTLCSLNRGFLRYKPALTTVSVMNTSTVWAWSHKKIKTEIKRRTECPWPQFNCAT